MSLPTFPHGPSERWPSGAQKHLVRGIGGFFVVGVVQRIQMLLELLPLSLWDLDAGQYPTVIGPVVAVMKKGDVPANADCLQELQQGARTLRKLKPVNDLVVELTGPS